jgi:anaphase-promoting complex subunit 6
MEEYLRKWRQDCLERQQYDSAQFVGDKLLALTSMGIYEIGTSVSEI